MEKLRRVRWLLGSVASGTAVWVSAGSFSG